MRPVDRIAAALTAGALLLLPGCASKKFVQDEMAASEEKIRAVESGMEENQRRIREVDGRVDQVDEKAARAQTTGDQALRRGEEAFTSAEEALRAARGTLLLETTLTNDITRFGVDQWGLPEGSNPVLDDLAAKVLGMNRRVYLEIQGHTDATGSEPWNLTLGQRRAEAVLRYLNQRGIPLYAMAAISYGSSQPAADNSSRDGRAQNRRVVVRVLE